MDQRNTFENIDQLLEIISIVFKQKRKASLIIDREGLIRIEGLITKVERNNNYIGETVIHIGPSNYFALDKIIAINGVFRSDYSEC